MRVCKRQMKGKIVFALLLAMLVTLVWPVSSYADELGDGTAADTVEKDAENGSDEAVDAGDDTVPEIEDEPESEDKDEAETDGKDSEPEESEGTAETDGKDSESEESEGTAETDGKDSESEESEGTAEVTGPDGDTSDDSTYDLWITFTAWDENGEYRIVSEVTKKNIEGQQTLKEMGITLPETKFNYGGLTQIGWKDKDGKVITEDTQFSESVYTGGEFQWNIIAQYDKNYIQAHYQYPDTEGNVATEDRLLLYKSGEVFGNLLKQMNEFVPEDITKEYSFNGWEMGWYPYDENGVIPEKVKDIHIDMAAKFAEGMWIELVYEYYDQNGIEVRDSDIRIVEEGASYITGTHMLMEAGAPQLYEGLKFRCWFYPITFDYPMKNGASCYTWAMYENFLIRYVINTGDEERIFCQVADRGETVDTMTTFEGLGEVTWDEGKAPGETYDVPVHIMNNSVTFSGSAEVIEKPAEPSKPSNPSTPSGSTSGSTSGDIKYPDKAVSVVIEEINSSTPGQTVQLNMNSWTSVPTEILEAAKGKDVNVVLVMDGYSWTINGKDIQTIYNRDRTDLKVTKNTNNIPGSTVTAVAGDNPSLQISLAHEGDFGFKATLSIGVGSEHAGKYGNLYYHDKNGKLVFIDAGQIDSEGNVSLVFSHASDYLLVISDQAMSQVNVPENLKPAGTNQNGTTSAVNTNTNVTRSPKTGDYTAVYPWLLLCAAAAGYTMVYSSRRKRVQK